MFAGLLAVSELRLQLETLLGDDHKCADLISGGFNAFELGHAPVCLVLVAVLARLGQSRRYPLRRRSRGSGDLARSFQ